MAKHGLALVQQRLRDHGSRRSGDDWTCPAHDDTKPSLTVKKGKDSRVVLACPKCKSEEVLRAIGLTWADVLKDEPTVVGGTEYLYTDKHGVLLFRVVRQTLSDGTKTFRQHKAKPRGGWEGKLLDAKRVLYGLPGVRRAIKGGHTIHLTEGEKDADALNAYFEKHGLSDFASCHSGGAEKWDIDGSSSRYLKSLRGAAIVVVWADRDGKGYADALERYESVTSAGMTAEIRLPIPTALKADVFDHLDQGHRPQDGIEVSEGGLRDLLSDAPDTERAEKVQREVERLRINHDAKNQFRADLIVERVSKSSKARRMAGADFFLDLPKEAPVLWGDGNEILWIDGEPLMIVGDDGTGKSTIDHQLLAARLGITSEVLEYSVAPADGTVVYLAMDRPEQARRAGRRLFPEDLGIDFRSQLQNLAVWTGPLPFDPLSSPEVLADWLHSEFGQVSEVHADSLKDLASNLTADEVGSRLNLAIQEVIGRGINWLGLHHQRKANGDNRSPDALADVYGSRWLTAGHGSILMLTRAKGDKDYVELSQVKEPADRIRKLTLRHDRGRGKTLVVQSAFDLETALTIAGEGGATVTEAVASIYPDELPSDSLKRKVFRRLEAKVKDGEVVKIEGIKGGTGGSQPARYVLRDEDES